MQTEELFEIWAPAAGPWTPWAKPVLFAHLDTLPADSGPAPVPPADVRFAEAAAGTCLVVDLPGAASVATGLALAEAGFRPVPLFNALPSPDPGRSLTVVDVRPTLAALVGGAKRLATLQLPVSAQPAFLLDYDHADDRRPGSTAGLCDNRSVSLPTDFPSGHRLRAAGVIRAAVVQPAGTPRADLTHTLLRWREAGIDVLVKPPDAVLPRPATLNRPRWYRSLLHGFLATLGLHRHRLGGFGGRLEGGGSGG